MKYLFLIFLLCTSVLSISQNISDEEKTIDSLSKSIDLLPTDREKVKELTTIISKYRTSKFSRKLIDKAIKISENANNSILLGHSYYSLASYFYYNSQLDSALIITKKSNALIATKDSPLLKASILNLMGSLQKTEGDLPLAITTLLEAKSIIDKIDTLKIDKDAIKRYKGHHLIINNTLANFYSKMENHESAITYYDNAYQAAINLGATVNAGVILSNKGDLYLKMKQYDVALETLKKAKKLIISGKAPPRFVANSNLNIGIAYFELKDYPAAEQNLEKAFKIYNNSDNQAGITYTLTHRGILFNALSNFKQAKEDCETAKKIALNLNDLEYQLKASECLFEACKGLGNYQDALQNHEFYLSIKDSIFNEKNIKKLTQLEMQYNFDKTQELQKTKTKEKEQERKLYLFFAFISLCIVIAFGYYRISLQKKMAGQESKRLQELDNLKSRFITNITHEFRTPLTIILGYLENLKEQYSSKTETINSLETIEKNSNNLLGLVNQMLDLAKLEQGKLQLSNKNNDIVTFIQHIVHSFDKIAEEKNIHLSFFSTEDEIKMDYDAEKLRQIITNLLSNALKFTSEGKKVNLKLSVLQKGSFSELKIVVKDQGVGVSQEELSNIFDHFYQVSSSKFKVAQGTGIGLALTKELVDLMKGSISVVSEIDKGSTFIVQLPITEEASFEDKALENIHASIGKTQVLPLKINFNKDTDNHILIVEDNTDMANYISSCLSETFQITHAVDGSKGLEKAIEQIPDLIITDVMMPIMDGFEMTQKLQQLEATNHIPIIMLTSKAMQEDKIEGLESGADAYLTKPFSKKELQIRIANLIAKRKQLQERYQTELVVLQKKKEQPSNDKNIIFLNKVINCIHNHVEDNGFNSEKLAKELGLSDSQLYRKLKAISNTSTAVFIRNIRLEKAKELLLDTSLTISEIAYATGFNDPSWFSKTFKTAFGKSPLSFRQS